MLLKGFRVGMLLQIAVGPICFYIFHTAATVGFLAAVGGVAGVAIVDTLYIFASLLGVGALIEKHPGIKAALKYVSAAVLILFGLNLVSGILWISFLPGLNLTENAGSCSTFVRLMLITLSNPLTIVFWTGVFSQRVSENALNWHSMALFGLGAVLSTLVFLTVIAALGGLTHTFLSKTVISILNLIVGLVLIAFGIRTLVKKPAVGNPA